MRPFIVLLFAIAVLGSLYGYLAIAERPIKATEVTDVAATGKFTVKLTIPFDAVASDFDIDDVGESLSVQLDGKLLLRRTDLVKRGEITINNVPGVKLGRNEFVVSAQPQTASNESSGFSLEDNAAETTPIPVPIRIQVFRDDILIGEKTTWNQPGLRLVSTIMVDIKPEFEAD